MSLMIALLLRLTMVFKYVRYESSGGATPGPAVPYTEGCGFLWFGRRVGGSHVLHGLLHALCFHYDRQELLSKGHFLEKILKVCPLHF